MGDRNSRDIPERADVPGEAEAWGCLSGDHAQGGRGEEEKPNAFSCKQISECSVLLHSSPAAVHSNMPLQQEGGKTEKLDKPLAHPSTWKESGFNAGEKGCKQNKRWFVLMVYSQDKNPFSSITCLAPFLQRREEEEKEAEWRWFKGITRTIKEEGKGNKGSKRNSALFQQVTLCLLAVWGWRARLVWVGSGGWSHGLWVGLGVGVAAAGGRS